MRRQTLKVIGGASLTILVLAVFALVGVSAKAKNGNEQGLVGSWDVQVTIRDCASGTPLFGFPAAMTFNRGGTMQESDLGGPGLVRLNGHGVWRHQTGREYSSAFRWLNFNPDRTFAGTSVVRQAISLGPDGDTFTSTDTVEVLDANGNVIPNAGSCATETGTRFQ